MVPLSIQTYATVSIAKLKSCLQFYNNVIYMHVKQFIPLTQLKVLRTIMSYFTTFLSLQD